MSIALAPAIGSKLFSFCIIKLFNFFGSLSNGVGKKQINFYIAPVENHWSYFVTNNLLVIKILALK